MKRQGVSYGELSVALALVAALLAVLAPGCMESMRTKKRVNQCAGNLHRLGLAFQVYADEHEGEYPPLQPKVGRDCDPNKGVLMFDWEAMAAYVPGCELLVCPDAGPAAVAVLDSGLWGQDDAGKPNPCLVDDSSYVYLRWAPASLGDGVLASREYEMGVRAFFEMPGALKDGAPAHPLSTSLPEQLGLESATIPVMADRVDALQPGMIRLNHMPGGSNVLYMDGHVEFVSFGQAFPVTHEMASFLSLLRQHAGGPVL